jgi:hypothetical protein
MPTNGSWSHVLTPIRHFTPPEAPDEAALLAGLRFVRGSEQVRDVGCSSISTRCRPSISRSRTPTLDCSCRILQPTQEDWRRHYGARWHDLARAKRRHDPDAVFASGPQLYFT